MKSYMILNKHEAFKEWAIADRRVDLLRATFFNAFLIILIGCIKYGLWLHLRIWLLLAILAVFAFITWFTARHKADDDLYELYEVAQEAEKQKGLKAV